MESDGAGGYTWPWVREQLESYFEMRRRPFYRRIGRKYWQNYRVQEEVVDYIIKSFFTKTPEPLFAHRREYATRALARARHPFPMNEMISHKVVPAKADRGSESIPSLAASELNSYVRQAAEALWRSGHYSEAVEAAAKSVNALLQSKVGRRDISESDLVAQAFTLKAPEQGKARLRVLSESSSPTYVSAQEGVMAFGRGCFMGIRNVIAHEDPQARDSNPVRSFSQLVAFSLFADWIEESKVKRFRKGQS